LQHVRNRTAPLRFEEWQASNRSEEDLKNLSKYHNKSLRMELLEDVVHVLHEVTACALENELDDWIAEAIGQAIGTTYTKPRIMNKRERKNAAEGQRHADRAKGRAQKKAKSMQRWEKWADAIFLTYSWNERKDHCVLAFSETYSVTGRLTDGYKFGARAARVCEKTAWSWTHATMLAFVLLGNRTNLQPVSTI
jgi:hypothetical protein